MFKNGIGRFDFPTSSSTDTRNSIKKIKEIKDDYALIKEKELDLFDYYNKNINTMTNDDTLFCKTRGNTGRDRWVYSITKNSYNLNNALSNTGVTTVEKFVLNIVILFY